LYAFALAPVSIYVSELILRMSSIIFASNALLIISGVMSFLSFSRRYLITPSPVGCITTKFAAQPNFRSTSLWTCDLPVTNMRVWSDSCTICPSNSSIAIRCSGKHSSSVSTYINGHLVLARTWNIFKIPDTCSPLPPIAFFSFREHRTTASGIPSNPLPSCRSSEPSLFTGDSSFLTAKSK